MSDPSIDVIQSVGSGRVRMTISLAHHGPASEAALHGC